MKQKIPSLIAFLLLVSLSSTVQVEAANTTAPEPAIEKIPIAGKHLTLKVPHNPAPGRPWLWVGEFGGHLKKLEVELLDQGWHVAYLPFSNKFGAPSEIERWEKAYDYLRKERDLAPRPALLGISRGGLYVNAWTRLHPDRVSVLYLDNGVCDPRSWPGGLQLNKKGRGSPKDWARYKEIFNFESDEEALENSLDPTKGFDAAIQNGVLLISVHGTADGTVPYEDNAKRLVDIWKQSGGRVEIFAKEGGRHHPHGLSDLAPLIELLTGTAQSMPTSGGANSNADRTEWFREARFGMFIHWGVYAVPAGEWKGETMRSIGEWIMRFKKIPVGQYKAYADDFTAEHYDPAFWRGDVWPSPNYQIASGLAAYGHKKLAADIADKTVANALKHGLSEHYNSMTGEALGVPDYSMASTILTMMLDGLTEKHKVSLRS